MPTLYDSEIIQQFADDLYARAKAIVITEAIKYAAIAFVIAWGIAYGIKTTSPMSDLQPGLPGVIAGAIGAAVGVSSGRAKAFKLKVEAQTLLCHRQVELNTREIMVEAIRGSQPSPPPPPPPVVRAAAQV